MESERAVKNFSLDSFPSLAGIPIVNVLFSFRRDFKVFSLKIEFHYRQFPF